MPAARGRGVTRKKPVERPGILTVVRLVRSCQSVRPCGGLAQARRDSIPGPHRAGRQRSTAVGHDAESMTERLYQFIRRILS